MPVTVTIQITVTGDGRNDVLTLTPQNAPLPINTFALPSTNPVTPAMFTQVSLVGSSNNSITIPETLSNGQTTRYVVVQRTGGGALNLKWKLTSLDSGVLLSTSAATPPLVWAIPQANPPTSFVLFNNGATASFDLVLCEMKADQVQSREHTWSAPVDGQDPRDVICAICKTAVLRGFESAAGLCLGNAWRTIAQFRLDGRGPGGALGKKVRRIVGQVPIGVCGAVVDEALSIRIQLEHGILGPDVPWEELEFEDV